MPSATATCSRSGRPLPVAKKKGTQPFSERAEKGCVPFFFEMGTTRADFLRLLPVAVGYAAWRIEGDEIIGEGAAPQWRIRITQRPERSFGSVRLPVLDVTLELEGASETQTAAFVGRFLLGYQRAGG